MYQNSKALLASSTFWFGVLQIAFAGVGFLFQFIDQDLAFGLFTTGLGTIGFRLKTTKPIESIT